MKKLRFSISKGYPTQMKENRNIHQDSVIGLSRDKEGRLWATAGHIAYGHIGVFCGENADTLEELYPAAAGFQWGKAGVAFQGTRYPDGPYARGEFWATGLWIDPETGIFHALIHNETGWSAEDSAYTVFRQETGEPDFRHIGYITSGDQGRTWQFERWAITSSDPCYTYRYQPDGLTGGQTGDIVNLGAGDLSVFYHEEQRMLYVFYSMLWYDIDGRDVAADKIYCARAKRNADGKLGEFEKYCDGAFCMAGNCGRETAVMAGGSEPCVAYSETIGRYIMTTYNRRRWYEGKTTLQVSYSDDLVTWSKPELCVEAHEELSLPYLPLCGREKGKPHHTLGDTFDLLASTNNTDVLRFEVKVEAYEENI